MDYRQILSELEAASTFELYRLQAAIARVLDDPERIAAIKRQLRPDMEISYFSQADNRLVPARIVAVRKTRAVVEDLETGKGWTIPLCTINLERVEADISPGHRGVDRMSLRLGDQVGFNDREGRAISGVVIKLNPKRAKVETPEAIWNVPYTMLFSVIDGERGAEEPPPLTLDAPDGDL